LERGTRVQILWSTIQYEGVLRPYRELGAITLEAITAVVSHANNSARILGFTRAKGYVAKPTARSSTAELAKEARQPVEREISEDKPAAEVFSTVNRYTETVSRIP
jgi:hypothetical protein